MNRPERDKTVEHMLDRYDWRVGQAVVGDNTCLARLLAALHLELEDDGEIANYLCSYLVA
jgi:hypothetical protein